LRTGRPRHERQVLQAAPLAFGRLFKLLMQHARYDEMRDWYEGRKGRVRTFSCCFEVIFMVRDLSFCTRSLRFVISLRMLTIFAWYAGTCIICPSLGSNAT
jgi:hypothetical protein